MKPASIAGTIAGVSVFAASLFFANSLKNTQFKPTTKDTVNISASEQAVDRIQDIVRLTWQTGREQAICIDKYTVTRKGNQVDVRFEHASGAVLAASDDTTVYGYFGHQLCHNRDAAVHTHVIDNGYLDHPSDMDVETGQDSTRTNAFDVLLSVYSEKSYNLQLYAFRR